ncbi:MAG: tetratricopeptide repeat protein [Bradyrhizobium sp.]
MGNALRDLRRFDEALASFERATALRHDLAPALFNRGLTLADLGRHEEALASYDRVIALVPGHADAHRNRGAALAAAGLRGNQAEQMQRIEIAGLPAENVFIDLLRRRQLPPLMQRDRLRKGGLNGGRTGFLRLTCFRHPTPSRAPCPIRVSKGRCNERVK